MINEEMQLKIDETFKSYHPDETKTNLCLGSAVEVFAASPNPDNELVFELTKKSPDELITLAVENITKEKQIMDEVMNVIEKWKSASLGTNAIRKALEYLSFDEDIQHSSNEWEEISKPDETFSNYYHYYIDDDNDKLNERISNATYSMECRINKVRDRWYRDSYWWVAKYTVKIGITTKEGKLKSKTIKSGCHNFITFDRALKSIEKRKKEFAHLFVETCPPVPKKYADLFKVSGLLLPGYRLED